MWYHQGIMKMIDKMNRSEKAAYNWLRKHIPTCDIVFQKRNSPDFITNIGEGYEAKLLRSNAITFTAGQLDKLLSLGNVDILVMEQGSQEPIAIIPIAELRDKPRYWHQYRIVSYEPMPDNNVNCICQGCGNTFIVKQGSRQRYCPECILKRVKHIPTKQPDKPQDRRGRH